ncbi:hypothetical protein HDV63DRAFT_295550 [Trichoderma sp. SZMC 28014]
MTKKLFQQLLNSASRRRLKEMTNWIFLYLFFSILRFRFLLHLCACALASSILLFFLLLAWNSQDYTFVLLFLPLLSSFDLLQRRLRLILLLGWLMGRTCLVYPPAWYRLETRELLFLHGLPLLDSFFIAFIYIFSFPAISYSHLYFHLSSFSPILCYPIFCVEKDIFGLWPMYGCGNGMEGGFGKEDG